MTSPTQTGAPTAGVSANGNRWSEEHVLEVRRWTDKLLSFRISRPPEFRFRAGHYARLGLGDQNDCQWRPLSMVSPPAAAHLEFVAVLVPGGAFSERLVRLGPGDGLYLERAAYGFLTLDQLAPGSDLWLLASGTGIGPFVSMLRDPEIWQACQRIVLIHSVRTRAELTYREEIAAATAEHPQIRCDYLPVVTRESAPEALHARIPSLLEQGLLVTRTGQALDPAHSRVMVCGNPDLLRDTRAWLTAKGFEAGRRGIPGTMVFEKYW